jgi:hypothetical protein
VLHGERGDSERAQLLHLRSHLPVAPGAGDIANVDGADAARVLADDGAVDLRILLAAVPDEDEGQRGVRLQQPADARQLVLALAERRGLGLDEEDVGEEERPVRARGAAWSGA